jgi:hypothetical protein
LRFVAVDEQNCRIVRDGLGWHGSFSHNRFLIAADFFTVF